MKWLGVILAVLALAIAEPVIYFNEEFADGEFCELAKVSSLIATVPRILLGVPRPMLRSCYDDCLSVGNDNMAHLFCAYLFMFAALSWTGLAAVMSE